ncbi:MAG TPA: sensor histidine kinase [Actinomycetes bacterium]|nr:sensor histidine kinase [Actinomycetes bacterium]
MNGTTQLPPAISRGLATARRILAGPDGFVVLALVLGLAGLVQSVIYTAESGDRTTASLLAMFGTLPVAFLRTRWAWLGALVITLATLVALSDPAPLTIAGAIAQLIAAYEVAVLYPRGASALIAAPFVLNAVAPFSGNDSELSGLLALVIVVAALILGDSQRQRGRAVAERDETRRAMADTLRDRAAAQERNRIARELHDVVAHHLSMIAIQAETARLTTPGMPAEGQAQLAAIGDTARDALTEMRRLLGVLRVDVDDKAELSPQPGLDRIDELIEAARAAGTPVRLTLSGAPVPLPVGVDLSAYRIVQEALTNARRHAPGAAVEVEVAYTADQLLLRIRDDGPGSTDANPSGHGLHGMRERAAIAGGSLTAGPAETGGFLVEATLPVSESAA